MKSELQDLLRYCTPQEKEEIDRLLAAPTKLDIVSELEKCRADVLYFIDNYCYTYDPRLLPRDPVVRFVLFQRQREFIGWIESRLDGKEDGIVEKSRDAGATFTACAYSLHKWLFSSGFSAGFGSRVEDLVDRKGDMDSIFEKIRFMVRRLPTWMLPVGYKESEHSNYMRLLNPDNGASITGEGGDNIGRGGRKTIYFVDEAAYLERAETIDSALSQTTNCRIDLSTPNGEGNSFSKRRHSGKIPVFTFHWKEDPRKNYYEVVRDGVVIETGNGTPRHMPVGTAITYPWYEKQCGKFDPVIIAREIDIDYRASVANVVIPGKWVQAAVDLNIEEGSVNESGFDVADSGAAENVYVNRRGAKVKRLVSWHGDNTTESAWKARDLAEEDGARMLKLDGVGVGAGAYGTLKTSTRKLAFAVKSLNGGDRPSDRKYDDAPGIKASERFLNLRAEIWWMLRLRFQRTYEHVNGIKQHAVEDLISIPNDRELVSQLTQPLYQITDTGKIKIESKKDMAKRGVKSPDRADALGYSFAIAKPEPTLGF